MILVLEESGSGKFLLGLGTSMDVGAVPFDDNIRTVTVCIQPSETFNELPNDDKRTKALVAAVKKALEKESGGRYLAESMTPLDIQLTITVDKAGS